MIDQEIEAWVEPDDLAQAHALLDELTQEVINIQDQLGASKEYDPERFDSEGEWKNWRRRAAVAHRHRVGEQRKVKSWIREHDENNGGGGSALQDLLGQVIERLETIIDLLSKEDGNH